MGKTALQAVHARVAIYRITSGTAQDAAETADANSGLRGIFRAQPGFQSYELVGTQEALISISRWESAEQADAASQAARSWAAEHLARQIVLEEEHVGQLVLSSSVPTVGP